MYGCDTQGVAPTLLKQQQSTIARAAAPEGGGKNPQKVLYALDGATGTLDPAFDAHAVLVKHWAAAWWEGWMPRASMTQAYNCVKGRFASQLPKWNSVAGPTAALWITFRRSGWHWTSATTACDDRWRTWDVLLDQPAIVAQAMKQTAQDEAC